MDRTALGEWRATYWEESFYSKIGVRPQAFIEVIQCRGQSAGTLTERHASLRSPEDANRRPNSLYARARRT